MPTNLGIDEKLLNEALRVGGLKTKKATVNEALREYIAHRKRVQGLKLFGTVEISEGGRSQSRKARRRAKR
jgi:Arc/MetJ family transcription regulator